MLYYQQLTIWRGADSLLGRLRAKYPGVDIGKYLFVGCLRRHERLNGRPVTEQCYVHSKLLIVSVCCHWQWGDAPPLLLRLAPSC